MDQFWYFFNNVNVARFARNAECDFLKRFLNTVSLERNQSFTNFSAHTKSKICSTNPGRCRTSKLRMTKTSFQGWASLVRKSFLRMITFMLVSFSQIISNIVVLNVDVFATDWECRSRDVYCIAGDAAGNQCYHWHTNLKFMQGQHQAAT